MVTTEEPIDGIVSDVSAKNDWLCRSSCSGSKSCFFVYEHLESPTYLVPLKIGQGQQKANSNSRTVAYLIFGTDYQSVIWATILEVKWVFMQSNVVLHNSGRLSLLSVRKSTAGLCYTFYRLSGVKKTSKKFKDQYPIYSDQRNPKFCNVFCLKF